MTNSTTLPGYTIHRDGEDLVFKIGPVAHRDLSWKILNCWIYGTPRMDPIEKFPTDGEVTIFPPSCFDFQCSIEDWNHSILPRLIARNVPALPDGGLRGEEFPTHAQELVGSWQQVVEVLCFVAVHIRDRACELVQLLDIGASLMGQLDGSRFFSGGDQELIIYHIRGALEHRHQADSTFTTALPSASRQLLWLVEEHKRRHEDSPLCWAESVFGLSIALDDSSGSDYHNVLWTSAPVQVELFAPVTSHVGDRLIAQLERILDDWNDDKHGQVRNYDKITDEQASNLRAFFAAEWTHLPTRCIGNGAAQARQGSDRFDVDDSVDLFAWADSIAGA